MYVAGVLCGEELTPLVLLKLLQLPNRGWTTQHHARPFTVQQAKHRNSTYVYSHYVHANFHMLTCSECCFSSSTPCEAAIFLPWSAHTHTLHSSGQEAGPRASPWLLGGTSSTTCLLSRTVTYSGTDRQHVCVCVRARVCVCVSVFGVWCVCVCY